MLLHDWIQYRLFFKAQESKKCIFWAFVSFLSLHNGSCRFRLSTTSLWSSSDIDENRNVMSDNLDDSAISMLLTSLFASPTTWWSCHSPQILVCVCVWKNVLQTNLRVASIYSPDSPPDSKWVYFPKWKPLSSACKQPQLVEMKLISDNLYSTISLVNNQNHILKYDQFCLYSLKLQSVCCQIKVVNQKVKKTKLKLKVHYLSKYTQSFHHRVFTPHFNLKWENTCRFTVLFKDALRKQNLPAGLKPVRFAGASLDSRPK